MKIQNPQEPGPVVKILCWFFAVWMALPASLVAQAVTLSAPTFPTSNTVRISVATGPVTNIRYNVYWTNSVAADATTWPLLATGAANQVIFDLALPNTNLGFFIVSSNYIATTNPPPKVATPVFNPPNTNGNASVLVTVTCDTPGAVIYYTTNNVTPTTSDTYIATGAKLLISCLTTAKARAFRTDFIDSDVVTGIYDVNCAPVVSAGTQQTTTGTQITLAGSSSDDGLAQPLSNYWRQVSGPATVTFGNVNSLTSTVDFPIVGIYVLQLEAFDGYWTSTSRVTVARSPQINVVMTTPANGSTFNVPTNIQLEATTSGSAVSVTQVQFFASSMLIGAATNRVDANGSVWTFQWKNVPAGNHSLYAVATSSSTSHLSLASSPSNITVNFPTDIGRFTIAANDLTIPVVGLPLTVNRAHDGRFGSGNKLGVNARLDYEAASIQKSGNLATGWNGTKSGINYCIRETASATASHVVSITLREGETYYFHAKVVFTENGASCKNAATEPTCLNAHTVRYEFTPAIPNNGSLAVSNLSTSAINADFNGNWVSEFFVARNCGSSQFNPALDQFTFTALDGSQYKFDTTGKLAQRIDRNNNSLTYGSTNIVHSSGKSIDFVLTSGRITQIRDSSAIATGGPAAIKYSYDGSAHMTNAARLIDRAGAGTYENTGYFYDDGSNPHLITRVIDPRGILTVSNLFDANGRLSRQYDALGNFTSFTYEENGRRQIVTDRNNKTTRQELTEAGQLESIQNAEGAVTSYAYDPNGRRSAEITAIGATNSYSYNNRDELTGVTNELNFSSSATYNSFGLPLMVIDASAFGTTNFYDAKGNLLSTTNALGIISRYGYDSQGNRKAETNAFGRVEQTITLYAYDGFGYLTNVTDALGSITAYSYDANGNLLTEGRERTLTSGSKETLWTTNVYDAANRAFAVIEPDSFTNRTVFNAIGKVAHTTNKLGVVTQFDYDVRGLLTNTIFALGTGEQALEQIAYDGEGRRTNSIDRANRPTGFLYDGVGRLRRTTAADGSYTENQYDVGGRIFATIQVPRPTGGTTPPPSGIATRYQYDTAGRRTAVVNALNQTNQYTYDRNGNQTNVTDALDRRTSYEFDALNRQTQVIFADQSSEGFSYDGLNRRVFVTNQARILAAFGYDGLGRLLAATNAVGTGTSNWATYAYNEVGNQTNQVDALNRYTRFEYDVMGRRTRTLLPQNQAEMFAYDAAGNLTRHTNFNGVILTNQYDALNRLTSRTSSSGYNVGFTYSSTGKRSTMSDASGTTIYAYDNRDRLATNSSPQGTLVYAYDVFGNLQSTISTRSGGAAISYNYDVLNRLTNASGNSASARYGFDAVGNLETVRFGNSVTNTHIYNSLNRLTDITAKNSSGTIASFAYQIGMAGNRTNLAENIGGTTRNHAWTYDVLYRLTNEIITGTAPTGTTRYQYDAVGNRTNRVTTIGGVAALTNQTFTYNNNDWISNDTFDSNGNTRTNAGNVYAYDAENRLTNYNSGAASYVYNGDGWLMRKTIGSTTTLCLVDDRNPTGFAQAIEEATVSGGVTNLAVIYLPGLDLVSQNRGGTISYYGYDGNGSARYLAGSGATITDTYLYDAYGVPLASTGSIVNEFRYTGERLIPETGLTYLRNRYLNTGTGRFWTRDPFMGVQSQPTSLHKYVYVSANPVNKTDPSGNSDFTLISFLTAFGGSEAVRVGYEAPRVAGYARALSAARTLAKVLIDVGTISISRQNNRRVIIGQSQVRVVQAASQFNAQPYVGPDDLSLILAWVRGNVIAEATFVDIGYDSDNLGQPTKYDDEVQALAGYPRKLVKFRGSMWGPETPAWAP
jgi:RHS repeat-associated protein